MVLLSYSPFTHTPGLPSSLQAGNACNGLNYTSKLLTELNYWVGPRLAEARGSAPIPSFCCVRPGVAAPLTHTAYNGE